MVKKNIVFIGYSLDVDLDCKYENRIALWRNNLDNLNDYEKIVDLGDILSKLFGKEKDNSLELELCSRIMSLIDNNTIAIVDTAFSSHGLFEEYEELYNQLYKYLKQIENKNIKFFLSEPLKFMGKIRYKSVHNEYNSLIKIMGNKVFLFKDKEFTKVNDLKKHENAFNKYISDNI